MNIRRPFALQLMLAAYLAGGGTPLRTVRDNEPTYTQGRMRFAPCPPEQYLRHRRIHRAERRRQGQAR